MKNQLIYAEDSRLVKRQKGIINGLWQAVSIDIEAISETAASLGYPLLVIRARGEGRTSLRHLYAVPSTEAPKYKVLGQRGLFELYEEREPHLIAPSDLEDGKLTGIFVMKSSKPAELGKWEIEGQRKEAGSRYTNCDMILNIDPAKVELGLSG